MLRFSSFMLFVLLVMSPTLKAEMLIKHCNQQTQDCFVEKFNEETKTSKLFVKNDQIVNESFFKFPVVNVGEDLYSSLEDQVSIAYTYDYEAGLSLKKVHS